MGKRRSNANIPSVKTIQDRLIDYYTQWLEMPRKRAALIVRESMEVSQGRRGMDDSPTLQAYVKEARPFPPGPSARPEGGWRGNAYAPLEVVDRLLAGHGIQVVEPTDGTASIAYVNMGHTYVGTLLFDFESGRFHVTSWGDFVEADMPRFEEEGW